MTKKQRKALTTSLTVHHIEAQTINLVDEGGNRRISMACSDGSRGGEGVAEIQFYASDGAPRLRIEVRDPGIATIQLLGPQHSESINIVVDPDRSSGIGIYDAEHRPVVNLGVRHSAGDRPDFIPNASVQVIDTGNNQVWSLPPRTAPSDKRTQTRDG